MTMQLLIECVKQQNPLIFIIVGIKFSRKFRDNPQENHSRQKCLVSCKIKNVYSSFI